MTSPWNDGRLECPMCGEPRAFTIDESDPSKGHCEVENKTYQIAPGPGARVVICGVCGKEVMAAFTREQRNAAGRSELVCDRCRLPRSEAA